MQNIKHLYGCLVPAHLTWSVCVKSDLKLAGLLLRVAPLVFGKLSLSIVKVIYGYAKNVRRIYLASGSRGLALYLKACYVLTQHIAGGQKAKSPWALGANVSRSRYGIPRIINPQHRRLIYQGDVGVIRLWLTLFGLYRVIEFKGALKLKTITNPGIDISRFRKETWSVWVPLFYKLVQQQTALSWKMDPSRHLTPWSIPNIRKSSPNSSGLPAVAALPLDILAFAADSEMYSILMDWLKRVDGMDLIWALKPLIAALQKVGESAHKHLRKDKEDYPAKAGWLAIYAKNVIAGLAEVRWGKGLYFGKLGFKEEPGKIRVFAMVNLITQTLMQPLHKWIFARLREIGTDGTYNQTAPVERLIKRFRKANNQFVASYDLSAATDRLPLGIQVDLLKPLLGNHLASLWAKLLTGRPYRLPKIANSYNLGFDSVYYAVGQPMGALSSWAMLALTHHAIVQLAAHNVTGNHSWFLDYAVLGDDVVIAHELVAAEYLRIMAILGVEVGLAKSMVSRTGSLEFAKRTWIQGREASPISLAELLVALCNLGALEELVRKCQRFVEIRPSTVARFAGFGYKNLARLPVVFDLNNRLGKLIAFFCRPGGVWPMPIEAWLSAVGPGRESRASDVRFYAVAQSLWSRLVKRIIMRNIRFEGTLHQAANIKLIEATKKVVEVRATRANGKRIVSVKREAVFGPDLLRLLGALPSLDEARALGAHTKTAAMQPYDGHPRALPADFVGSSVNWNTFFTEWVAYPFTESLRKVFKRIDDILRVLDPGIQPQWKVLDEIWSQIFEADEGQSALPTQIEYFTRENDEVPPSTRLVGLWKELKSIVSRRATTSENLWTTRVEAAEPRRRRAGH